MKMTRDLLRLVILVVIIGLLPLLFSDSSYIMHILIMSLIWSGVVVGWDLMMGYAGIFTFGQVGIFVVGAYAAGMLAKYSWINPWIGILLGGITAAVTGILIGLPCLRLRGVYVGLVTFAFHLVLAPIIKLCAPIGTGGAMCSRSIPPLMIGEYTFTVGGKVAWFYLLLIVCTLLYFLNCKVIHSKFGLAFTALRDAENLAKTVGVDNYKTSLMVFAFSSFLTGILGGFYVQYVGIISTKILGMDTYLIIMVMLILGGIGRFPGAIIGTFLVIFLSYYLRPLGYYRLFIFGLIVIIAVIFMPQGVMGLWDSITHTLKKTFKRIAKN